MALQNNELKHLLNFVGYGELSPLVWFLGMEPAAYLDGLQARVSALRVAQTETEKELSALLPSVLDRAFKGEL